MNASPKSALWKRCLFFSAVVAGACAAAWGYYLYRTSLGRPQFPPPPYSKSRYLNTGPEAHYVGVGACKKCHRRYHKTYLLTPHSRALADLDPKQEPPDGSFFHAKSGRSYRIYRRGNQLRHEEVMRNEKGQEIARLDWPIRYVIGSGEATRSYLVELDGFLMESPVTWYRQREKHWDVSPGYDLVDQPSFERPVGVACLLCHSGRAETHGGSFHRVKVYENAIGCENCHGPGSLHVEFHNAGNPLDGLDDLTIVNPSKLPRDQYEAICAQCHLHAASTIMLRGRKKGDFRPGRPLTDYRVEYRFQETQSQMTVVGHIEQLRLSRCYQGSKTLTCSACHDPHARAKPKDPVSFYRNKCLACHETEACGLDRSRRLKQNAADDCLACHMPRADTDIPHVAFTHHRIGVHKNKTPRKPSPALADLPDLVPLEDDSHLSDIDRRRNLGLAYVEVAYSQDRPWKFEQYRLRAIRVLESVRAEGLLDGQTEEALARLYFKRDTERSVACAKRALTCKNLGLRYRHNANYIVAEHNYQIGRLQTAARMLEDLTHVRRHTEDWFLLGLCRLKQNQPRRALKVLQRAATINPFRTDIQAKLADVYGQLGDRNRAEEHNKKAIFLSRFGKGSRPPHFN